MLNAGVVWQRSYAFVVDKLLPDAAPDWLQPPPLEVAETSS